MVFAGDEEDIPSVEAARAAEAAQEKQLEAEAKGAKYLAKHPKKNKVCMFVYVWGGGFCVWAGGGVAREARRAR